MNRLTRFTESCAASDLKVYCQAAGRAALTAGSVVKQLYAQPHNIEMKGDIDLVTEADIAAETSIVASLNEDAPGLKFLAEESFSDLEGKNHGKVWVIDPIDGTTNFAHGIPIFAVSIAMIEDGQPKVGVIYCPMQDELFCTSLGGGSWLNGERIEVTGTDFLLQSLLATGFPYDIHENLPGIISRMRNILPKVRDIRRMGAAAVDLAYVACGRLDGFWEVGLKPWDTAAGCLLVEEAGGRVSDFMGQTYSPFKKEILASNGRLHQLLLELVG
ncbi:MAG: inositol monophosphatase family protein [Desulfobulbaceae bacterium]|nr:inositol monophosphatase family protein [Desulfobulbaceae bacterium]